MMAILHRFIRMVLFLFVTSMALEDGSSVCLKDDCSTQVMTNSSGKQLLQVSRVVKPAIRNDVNVILTAMKELWLEAGCLTEVPEAMLSHSQDTVMEQIRNIAASSDPVNQTMCYGFSKGEYPDFDGNLTGTSVKLLDFDSNQNSIRTIKCSENSLNWRKENNITVNEAQQQLKRELFAKVTSAFHSMGAPVILSSGTMLGFWRECDHLAHDSDLDVAIFHRFLPRNFRSRLEAMGFNTNVRVPEETQFDNADDNMGLEVALTRHQNIADGLSSPHIDVFIWEEGEVITGPSGHRQLSIMEPLWPSDTQGFWNCSARFESLAHAHWLGVDVFVPYPPELYLEDKYGKKWSENLQQGWGVYSDCNQTDVIGRRPWSKRWHIADRALLRKTVKGFHAKV